MAVIFVAGAYATYARFALGFAASTNLSDPQPWGLWVGLGTLCGVGLSAGGFAIAAAVYLLGFERYRPLLRTAVTVSFLGYLSVMVGNDVRTGIAMEDLASHRDVESAFSSVRGFLVRDALQHRTRAGILAGAGRENSVETRPGVYAHPTTF